MSTLAFILDEPDVRNNIIGVPLFAHTMLAFSAVFLLKMTLKWNLGMNSNHNFSLAGSPSAARTAGLYINSDAVQDLVDRVIILLKNAVASEKHLTKHIAAGLSKMLASFILSFRGPARRNFPETGQHQIMATPPSQSDYPDMNDHLCHSKDGDSFTLTGGPLADDFGFSFDEAWQDFPATTLDFLTSSWQDTTAFP